MNPLPWMMLVFLLSARSSLADVDQDWLRSIVRGIRAQYGTGGQFSLAANIPLKLDPNNLHTVLPNDDGTIENIKNTLNGSDVYRGNNVVIAKPKQGDAGNLHAEYRVLTNLDRLIPNARGNFLLIYSYLSPCDHKCTNTKDPFNIIDIIKDKVIPKWHNNVAFVFKKVFNKPKSGSGSGPNPAALRESLKRLGKSGIGLKNIFRCDYIGENSQCLSCSSEGSVSKVCVDNDFVPGQGASRSRIRDRSSIRDRYNTGPETEKDRSRSPISRGPRRNRSSTKRRGERRGRSRMSRLDEFWFLI